MYLKKIELVNFKGIKKFESEFTGNVYFITGENELGKSSVLEAIARCLTGKREAVLKNGEEKGYVNIEIGDYTVEWRYTEKNPKGTMTIKTPDGMKSDNVSMLQKIFCYQDFDAEEFSSWSNTAEGRRKQVEVVKNLLPENVRKRLAEIDEEYEKKFNSRAEENSTLKAYKAIEDKATAELPNNPENYSKPMDLAGLLEEQAKETKIAETYKQAKDAVIQRTNQIKEIPEIIEKSAKALAYLKTVNAEKVAKAKKEYEEAIEALKKKLQETEENLSAEVFKAEENHKTIVIENGKLETEYKTKLANAETFIKKYEAAQDGKTVAEKLKEAQEHNENNKRYAAYQLAKKNREESQKKAEAFDKELKTLLSEKENLIKNSQLPIEGLSFTADGLELKGVPFAPNKVSDSQIMEVATALIIASNPNVKIFKIARGESLGSAKLKALVQLAKERGYQGFIEQVQRDQNELRVEEYNEK